MARRRRSRPPTLAAGACLLAAASAAGGASTASSSLRAVASPAPPPPRSSEPPPPSADLSTFRFSRPVTRPASSSSHSTPPPPVTTPDDFDLADIALVTTLDGRVHALKRETGQWVWTLHDPGGKGGGWVGQPLVHAGRIRADVATGNVTVRDGGKRNDLGLPEDDRGKRKAGEEEAYDEAEEEEIYAIEPHSDGDIYVFVKDADAAAGTLQKLPLSISQLVSMSPFTFPGDTSRIFVGRKESRLVGVDLKTGKLVGVFGPNDGWCEWREGKDGMRRSGDECEEGIEGRPEDLLYMGRTDYIVSIYSKPGALLQTLRYSTYAPSSLNAAPSSPFSPSDDFSAAWTRTPDERYLEPMHDGNLFCFRAASSPSSLDGGLQWRNAFDVPVVGVFDIAFHRTGQDPVPTPILFSQPRPLPTSPAPGSESPTSSSGPFESLREGRVADRAFLGRHGDSYFAMSSERYPLVAFAPLAKSTAGGGMLDEGAGDEEAGEERKSDRVEIVGTHVLSGPEQAPHGGNLIEGGEDANRLGIDPPSGGALPAVPAEATPPTPAFHRAAQMSSLLARRFRDQLSISDRSSTTAANPVLSVTFVLLLVIWLAARRAWGNKWDRELRRRARTVGRQWFGVGVGEIPEEERQRVKQEETIRELLAHEANGHPVGDQVGEAETRSANHLRVASATKELPPLPVDEEGESEGEAEDKEEGNGDATKPKRPRRARKRGKRPGQKAAAALAAAASAVEAGALGTGAENPELLVNGGPVNGIDVKRLDGVDAGETVPTSPVAVGPAQIGSLIVTDETLGYGSHGTVVVKGRFQGREVAVKRLLKDFVTLASHEVSLLQESDDHPNVVRYFVKESRANFLYIALELCPASLFDVIERPKAFPQLEAVFNPKRALRQITAGLQHLHKLKIVHRDIKPQNILVAPARAGDGLRMLISDFGLCKKLEMDESSFAQTANHAAGSFGYRAPEILRGQVNPNDQSAVPSTSSSTQGSSPADGSPEAEHRLTRSIDIFSLGCIFYYVLTKGEHPFGNRYEREVNILKGEVNVELLDGLDAESYEAQALIRSMVHADAKSRPTAEAILQYPYFWSPMRRLLFLCDASDRFEIMERDPPAPPLVTLEDPARVASVLGGDWIKRVDKALVDNLGKYRKYEAGSVRDLLRVLRNKKHHFQDLPDGLRKTLGDLPDGFLFYFTHRFPSLLLHVYSVVELHLRQEGMFRSYWEAVEEV